MTGSESAANGQLLALYDQLEGLYAWRMKPMQVGMDVEKPSVSGGQPEMGWLEFSRLRYCTDGPPGDRIGVVLPYTSGADANASVRQMHHKLVNFFRTIRNLHSPLTHPSRPAATPPPRSAVPGKVEDLRLPQRGPAGHGPAKAGDHNASLRRRPARAPIRLRVPPEFHTRTPVRHTLGAS